MATTSPDYEDQRKAEERIAPRAAVVYETIRREGEDELERSTGGLSWSGLAAGLSMGFSFLTEALLHARLPEAPWRPLIAEFGYSVGFLIVILGRQQLFTENTLTPILQLLHCWDMDTLKKVARLWAIVLAANILGGLLFAWVISTTDVVDPEMQHELTVVGLQALTGGFWTTVLRGIFAGWLIALMIWLLPFAETARVIVIILITYIIGIGGFPHVIAGSIETLYLIMVGEITWWHFVGSFFIPSLIGNSIGGVTLVAAVNYAQVASDSNKDL